MGQLPLRGSRVAPLHFSMFIHDLGSRLCALDVRYEIYAREDVEVFRKIRHSADHLFQHAVDSVAEWAARNRMLISTPKCAIIKSRPDSFVYTLDGTPIQEVDTYRDLGVRWDSYLKFRSHVVEIAKSSGRLASMILRCFPVAFHVLR